MKLTQAQLDHLTRVQQADWEKVAEWEASEDNIENAMGATLRTKLETNDPIKQIVADLDLDFLRAVQIATTCEPSDK
jgi:hypothetical protein